MDWSWLFFSFSGRINRAKFWIASLLLTPAFLLAVTVVYVVILLVTGDDAMALPLAIVTTLVGLVFCAVAIATKRLHDRDKSAWWLLLFYLAPAIAAGIGDAAGNAGPIFHVISSGISLWALVELGFLRGTDGPNRFGPDPLTTRAARPGGAHSLS